MRRLVQALKQAEQKTIVVVGDLMLDEYLEGRIERISPEAPVPIMKEKAREFRFGGATNVALNCRRAGCLVHVIGLLGECDDAGDTLFSMLVDKKIFVEGIVRSSNRMTTTKKRIVSRQQQLLRIDSEETHELSAFERDNLICNVHTVIRPGSLVLISDYAKGCIDRSIVEEVLVRARLCGSLVIANPKGPNFAIYKGVDYIKPNLKMFHKMLRFFGLDPEDSIVDNAREICEQLKLKGMVITMGAEGLQFVSQDEHFVIPACKREVYDITGAGDTVLAFLAVGLVHDFSVEQSLRLSNFAASLAVCHRKTYAVGLDELLESRVESTEKIYTHWKGLKTEVDWLRKTQKRTIVLTNGCFDLLHSGHIHLLQEAKKKGDVLVVALNTDESVTRLKGPGRPIKSFEERAAIMAAIDAVDYVVPFDQDTPYKLIEYIKPDVLIKGGLNRVEAIIGHDVVTAYGGAVEIVAQKKGLSTTGIVSNVKERVVE